MIDKNFFFIKQTIKLNLYKENTKNQQENIVYIKNNKQTKTY